ncbi:MAG TPA: hypothetical protein PLM16_02700, partial [Candidatus Woesebacteria bacterium]|nr:hypothetical protein [Candidatus Woesebacteria bacterium]
VFEIPTVEINQEFSNSFKKGEKVSEEIFQMMTSLVTQLKKQQLTKAQIRLDQQGFVLNIGREKYLIESNNELAMTIAKTKVIHERLEEIIQGKFGPDQKMEVDMRFELPVIRAVNS